MVSGQISEAITRQLSHLGDAAVGAFIESGRDGDVKIVLPHVIMVVSYDLRDRYLSVRYRSHQAQLEFESAGQGKLHLYDTGDSPMNLLRDRGIVISGIVEVNDPVAINGWFAQFFESLRDDASDMLSGTAGGLGKGRTAAEPVVTWVMRNGRYEKTTGS